MRFKILIVDDEENIRDILISIVEMIFVKDYPFLKVSISTAKNGKEALYIAKKENQDIIISDIVMPIMDGFELIQKIRLFDLSVPILVLSALNSSEQIDKIMQSGATNYTSKPINGKLFTAQVRLFVDFFLRRHRRYNYKAINLFSKNIYKRKTEFLIDKEDDLVEFWEFILDGIFDKYRVEKVLHFIYDIELLLIKNGISNTIILEEDNKKYYFTLLEMQKIKSSVISKVFNKFDINEDDYKSNDFFISLVLIKDEKDVKPIVTYEEKSVIQNIETNEKKASIKDIRYSLHENVTPEEFLSELDPTYEDKIENFLENLNFVSIEIFNLSDATLEDAKTNIKNIMGYLSEFDSILSYIGLFDVINRSFGCLINFLENIDNEVLVDAQKRLLLSKMLQGLVNDLESWITVLFMERTAVDIHYLDASFAENCFTIESTFTQTEDEDSDLEFF